MKIILLTSAVLLIFVNAISATAQTKDSDPKQRANSTSSTAQTKVPDPSKNPGYDEITIIPGKLIASGDGCDEDNISVTITEDKRIMTVLFDNYYADSLEGRRGRDRKSCNIAVPIHIPHGFSVAVVGLDYRGYLEVPAGARASLDAEYFFAGQNTRSAASFTNTWFSNEKDIYDDFFVEHEVDILSLVWSPCGSDTIIRANTELQAIGDRDEDGPQAFIQMDSVDVSSKVRYQLQWKECTQP